MNHKEMMKAEAVKQQKSIPLMEEVCMMFNPHPKVPDKCGICGHSQPAHNPAPVSNTARPRVVGDGDTSRIIRANTVDDTLAPGFYVLENSMSGLYLAHRGGFDMPKLYGEVTSKAERILQTFHARDKSMGVMCSGKPGTGKTILAKRTCNMAAQQGMPVILMRQAFAGAGFSSLLEDLPSRCVFFIDEVEKIYDHVDSRNYLLSVLDGSVSSKHLWIMTCNNPDIGEAFRSRPGRIRYHHRFVGLDDAVVTGIIEDNIGDEGMRKLISDACFKIHELTPDMLMSIIEEVVIHGEAPSRFLDYFNIELTDPKFFTISGMVMFPTILLKEAKASIEDLPSLMDLKKHARSYGMDDLLDDHPSLEKFTTRALALVKSTYEYYPLSYPHAERTGDPMVNCTLRLEHDAMGPPVNVQWPARSFTVTTEGRTIMLRHNDGEQYLQVDPSPALGGGGIYKFDH
jgi:hypothetical protein